MLCSTSRYQGFSASPSPMTHYEYQCREANSSTTSLSSTSTSSYQKPTMPKQSFLSKLFGRSSGFESSEDAMEKQKRKEQKRQQRREDFEKVKGSQRSAMSGGVLGSSLV